MPPTIRAALPAAADAIWRILEPTFRARETCPNLRDISHVMARRFGPDSRAGLNGGGIAATRNRRR